jgi:hypothetical protein
MRRAVVVLFVAFLAAVSAFGQTAETGAIAGRVLEGKTPLAGVAIEARSAALQGVRSGVTDRDGSFRFALLPPGQYAVTAALSGFGTVLQRNITVGLGKTVTMDMRLQASVSQEITVSGAAPIVDVTSTVSGVNVTAEMARALPLARSYTSATSVAPGTRNDDVGAAVYGSTGAENQYIIDGLNVTDGLGMVGKDITVDFVQELEVLTGGLPAEYGRATGGIIHAVTKSGSNDFKGSVFGYTSTGSMIGRPKYLGQMDPLYTSWSRLDRQFDYGLNAGGPILRDRLWAFGAYDQVRTLNGNVLIDGLSAPGYSVPAGGEVQSKVTKDLRSAKLTMALTSRQMLTASMFGDPGSWTGVSNVIEGPPSTWQGRFSEGADDYVGRYSGIFGTNLDVNALAGRNRSQFRFSGDGVTPVLIDYTTVPKTRSGGIGRYNNGVGSRDVLKLDTTALVLGNHAVKIGVDQERQNSTWSRFFSGGARVEKYCSVGLVQGACPPNGVIYYQHTASINDLSPTFNPKDPSTYAENLVNPVVSRDGTMNRSFYVQDAWTASAFTINAGFRLERQVLKDRRRSRQLAVNNAAPRLGMVWDPHRDGRSKVYAFYGRYFESLPGTLDTAGPPAFIVRNLSPGVDDFAPDPRAPAFPTTKTQYQLSAGAGAIVIDPHIKGQYLDEYIVGYDREIGRAFTAGMKASYRNMPRIIEDMSVDPANGGWIIGNPGLGLAKEISYADGELVPAPRPVRRNAAVEIHASRRFSGNAQFLASYVWSRLYGNYEGLYEGSIGQLAPNVDTAYDYADFLVNAYGPLPADRTHQLKGYGSYEVRGGFARGLTLGLAAHWYSGTPLAAQGLDAYYYNSSFLTARGSLGRSPSDYEADVHFGYPVVLHASHVELLLDVFNVLNRQGATLLDTNYNTWVQEPCAGVPAEICSRSGALLHKPGTVEPIAQLQNPRATAPNPHFLKGESWTSPRQIRLGARMRF